MKQMTRSEIVQTIRDSINKMDNSVRELNKEAIDKDFVMEAVLTAIRVLEDTEQQYTPDDNPMPHEGIESLELLLWEISIDRVDCTAYRDDMRKAQRVNAALIVS